MFTGLIGSLGTVERLAEGSTSCRLTVRAPRLLSGVKIGDSIAVNGVCLTVVHLRGDTFTADVMPETVRRTTLHLLQSGDRIVQGHVEGVGTIQQIISEGNARVYRIQAPGELLRYIVEKGSIAVDGISLTVTETDDSGFGVSLIPHTAKMTTLGYKSAGDAVNLETDILARYVEKMLGMDKKGNGFAGRHKPGAAENNNSEPELTEAFLLRHGF